MIRLVRLLFVIHCAWGCAPSTHAQIVVQDGQPCATIVTATRPSASAQRAVAELQHYVELISGAKLPSYAGIDHIPPDQRALMRLFVGQSEALAALGVAVPLGDDRERSREGFVLKSVAKGLAIAGNEDANYRGTEYAVYELLERLGCRWFFPGEFGQVAPKQRTLVIPPLNEVQRPSFVARSIGCSGWTQGGAGHAEWLLRNKGTTDHMFDSPGDGTLHKLAPPQKYARVYPQIYGIDGDGVRRLEKPPEEVTLCVTSPKTTEIAAETIIGYFRQHPDVTSFGFSTPDASGNCRCANCLSANHLFKDESDYKPFDNNSESISDWYFNFVNNVTWVVTKEFPDHFICVLAYANHFLPPEGLDRPWNPNIIVTIAPLRMSLTRPLNDPTDVFSRRYALTLAAWARICPRLMIYDYELSDLTRMPFWMVHAIRANVPLYKTHNVIGFSTEANYATLRTGLNFYIRAKLMWNVRADVDALLEDFYTKFFGHAAPPMKQFIGSIQEMMASTTDHICWSHDFFDYAQVYPMDKLRMLSRHLDKAAARADSDAIKQRVRAYRALYDYMMTYQEVMALERDGQYQQALKAFARLAQPTEVAETIQPGLLPPVASWVENKGEASLRRYLTALAARSDGELGRRLGLAPRAAQFRMDPRNEGFYEQWQRDEVADKLRWDNIQITRDWSQQGYRDKQGRAYEGYAWYRFGVEAPLLRTGERAFLYIVPSDRGMPGVSAERRWMWVNGHLVWSPRHKQPKDAPDIDVTRWLKPGAKNSVTLYLYCVGGRSEHLGLMDRPLLWGATRPSD